MVVLTLIYFSWHTQLTIPLKLHFDKRLIKSILQQMKVGK